MTKSTQMKLRYLTVVISGIITNYVAATEMTNPNIQFDLPGVSQSDFGGVGLLQMPTARMANQGEFSANYRDNDEYRRYSVSLQMLEWLETTIRYTDTRTMPYSYSSAFSGTQTHKDKGIDIKATVLNEAYYVPQIAVGVRDVAGTGLFDGEYVSASKRIGNFDFTFGYAWGYLGQEGNSTNIFCSYSGSYCSRPSTVEHVGQFELGNMFKGKSSIYGGIEYQTSFNPLRIKFEYDGNDYSDEFAGNIKQSNHFNFGLVYRLTDNLETSLNYERGNNLMWGVTLRTNFNSLSTNFIDHYPPTYSPHPATSNKSVDWNKVSTELEQYSGYYPVAVYDQDKQISVVAEQTKYRDQPEAEQRAATVLANHLPQTTQQAEIITTNLNQPVKQIQIDIANVHRQLKGIPIGETDPTIYRTVPITAKTVPVWKQDPDRLKLSAEPTLAQSFGGPESFYMYQVGAKGGADYFLTNNWVASGTVNLNIINNYDQFNYKTPPADGAALPRVRTWIREYITSSDVLLTNLQLTRIDNPVQDLYSQIYGGYLEMMYAGTGSEMLYKPYGRSWAVGIDANYVKQRDWNDIMQLADYDVFTGHLTTYWELPFVKRGLAKISVGQYLAGDKGVTVDLSRQFDSGIIAGAYVTKTNVSAADYGEGSFTKGFYISIPLDLMLVHPTKQRGTITWVPLTRDGGQMLGKRYSLYKLTEK